MWKQNRRFSLRTLRDLGFGKAGTETSINEEADMLLQYLKQQPGQEFIIANLFNVPTVNVLWKMIMSKRFKVCKHPGSGARLSTHYFQMEDPTVQNMMNDQNATFKHNKFLLYYLPQVARMFPEYSGIALRKRCFKNLFRGFVDEIEKHQSTLNPNEPRDFIDAFLVEGAKEGGRGHFGDKRQLLTIIMDLFQAGSETTSTTLKWLLLFMALHEDVQRRCREEIWTNVGRDRQPTCQDILSMPYCQATISEVQRMGCVAPLSMPRRAGDNVKLAGYDIPKDTAVLVNHLHLMMSAEMSPHGQDPSVFDPCRFLNSSGDKMHKNIDAFMPFGSGKRVCLGETLARASLGIFFIRLLQKLHFSPPSNSKHPLYPNPSKWTVGGTRICHDFLCPHQCR